MNQRPRRLRSSAVIRNLVAETTLSANDFLVPLFIEHGKHSKSEIHSMPGYYRFSLDEILNEIEEHVKVGLKSFLLFVKENDDFKDNDGTAAANPNGLMQMAIHKIKSQFPDIILMSDVALDPYSTFGHDGIVENNEIVNDKTNIALAAMAVSHANAGVDWVAPSDMMDGRVAAIRKALDDNGFSNCGIMAYSAKYASCFYGPFRDALDSAPGFGDKKTYQMNPANVKEGVFEAQLDLAEGADMVMVKPAGAYLDVIKAVKEIATKPVSAYQVSGEYAMIKAAAAKGWVNEDAAIIESLTAIKRAGADVIATYFAKTAVNLINKS